MDKKAVYPEESVSNAHVFQWTQAIHRDLTTLRDNHLVHMAEDITNLKHDMAHLKDDVDELKTIKDEALSILRRYSWRIVLGVFSAIGAALGTPVALEMV